MRITRLFLYFTACYLALGLYFAIKDSDAFWLFLILTPPSGLMLFLAVRSKHVGLSVFTLLFFLTHGIEPAFFFLNKENYARTGWGAVGDFDFEIGSFLKIYLWPYAEMAIIYIVVSQLRHITGLLRPGKRINTGSFTMAIRELIRPDQNGQRYSIWLACFVICFAFPIVLVMSHLDVGLVGLRQQQLPFKMTGILNYIRTYMIPLVIFMLYAKSKRSWLLALFIVFYAIIAGIGGISRSVIFYSSSAVIVFCCLEKQIIRLGMIAVILIGGYFLVNDVRLGVYGSHGDASAFSLIGGANIGNAIQVPAWEVPFEFMRHIVSRLGGAQDVVLAHQYDIDDQWDGICRYFSSQPIVDVARELYGLEWNVEFVQWGAEWGVGMSTIPMFMLLAKRSIVVLLSLNIFAAFVIVLVEEVKDLYMSLVGFSFLPYIWLTLVVYVFYTNPNQLFVVYALFAIAFSVIFGWRLLFRERKPQRFAGTG